MKPVINSVLDEIAIDKGCYYDPALSHKIKEWIETYCIQSVQPWQSQPIQITPRQWSDWILPAYAWKKKDGSLRYKQVMIFCPKKIYGKTSISAAIGTWHLTQQNEGMGNKCAMIASSAKQAENLFDAASDYIELSPLGAEWKVHKNLIDCAEKRSSLQIYTSGGKVSGPSLVYLGIDEITEWNPAKAREIWARLKNSNMARPNSMQVITSTANLCPTTHIGYEWFKYALDLKAGKITTDWQTLPIVYQVPLNEDWRNPEVWQKHLPIGEVENHPSDIDYFIDEYNKAKDYPSEILSFRTFLLNQFCQSSSQSYIPTSLWDSCKKKYDESELYGMGGVAAFDLARRGDLAAVVYAIPVDGIIHLVARAFLPEGQLTKKSRSDGVDYRLWSEQGLVTITEGNSIDYATIRGHLLEDCRNFGINEVVYDPYDANETRSLLEQDGLSLFEFGQDYASYDPCMVFFEKSLVNKTIAHDGNPVLAWCAPAI